MLFRSGLIVAHVRASLPASVHVRGWSFSSTHGHLHSRARLWALVVVCAVLTSSLCHAVNGWWCWVFAAAHGAGPSSPFVAGGVVTALCCGRVVLLLSSSMGWPTHCMWRGAQLVCYPVSTVVLGLQTRLVNCGGDDDRVAAHIPQHPHHIRGVGAPLIRYPVCTIILGLQTRLVRWGR